MMKKAYSFVAILSAIIFCSCSSSDKQIAANLYKEREYLLKEFKDKSILNRGNKFYQLSYYRGQSVNTFFFEKKDSLLSFTKDTLQYPISEIAAFASINSMDSSNYIRALYNELSRLLKVMDRLKINNVSAEFASAGIDMKIYFGDYNALLYISNIATVKNEKWKSYIKSGEKLDENWYSVKDEL